MGIKAAHRSPVWASPMARVVYLCRRGLVSRNVSSGSSKGGGPHGPDDGHLHHPLPSLISLRQRLCSQYGTTSMQSTASPYLINQTHICSSAHLNSVGRLVSWGAHPIPLGLSRLHGLNPCYPSVCLNRCSFSTGLRLKAATIFIRSADLLHVGSEPVCSLLSGKTARGAPAFSFHPIPRERIRLPAQPFSAAERGKL